MDKIKCIGAILGDAIGSKFELSFNDKIYPLIEENKNFLSDDSMLTLATMDYLLHHKNNDIYAIYLKKWYKLYPNSKYGYSFKKWCESDSLRGYKSIGNGCLMRISPIVYFYDDLNIILIETRKNVEATHNEDESIISTKIFMELMYYAKNGKTKEFLKDYLKENYQIDVNKININKETVFAYQTLLNCLYFFFKTNNLKELIVELIKFNGDIDTNLAISLSLGEFYYKIDSSLLNSLFNKVIQNDQTILDLIKEFNEKIK